MDPVSLSIFAVLVGAAGLFAFVHVSQRLRRQGRDSAALKEKLERNLYAPRSLHPVIDPDLCIGSLSCLSACPEGDILGIIDGAAKLVQADHCIGHGRCAAECPMGAIKLVMGTAERGVDLPEVDQYFESSRPGVHVVGELAGMGLIRNAIEQGVQVSRRLAAVLPPGTNGAADVVIVGAGPAGLATAFGLRAAGLKYRLLEQSTVGGSIAHYPRHKVVMTDPVEIPLYGKIGSGRISKEKLLTTWNQAIAKGGIHVEEGTKVEGIEGEDGHFSVATNRGPVAARKVVLAIGRRGSPRKLGVPGEELPKVAYGLIDPEQYQGARVLVVGGGDSALEAAFQLAESGARATVSYRGETVARAREANRRKLEELHRGSKLRMLYSSQVKAIAPGDVTLMQAGREGRLPNDYVLALIGGELPVEFLKKAGVEMRRYFGEELGKRRRPEPEPVTQVRRQARPAADDAAEKRPGNAAVIYAAVGALIIAFLTVKGWDYYTLSRAERLRSPLHASLRSSGPWGHGVGLVATAFMLSNFLYAVRKRSAALKGLGGIRRWLDFHVFVGFMSPLVIAFHSVFQSNNLLATGTAAALGIVVLTGIIGRFIYAMVPSTDGRATELAELAGRFERLRERAQPALAGARDRGPLEAVLARATGTVPGGSLLKLVVAVPGSALRLRLELWRVRKLVADAAMLASFRESLLRLNRLRFQIAFYQGLRRLLRVWRVFHASLAGFLVLAIAAHIGVSLFFGYGLK